jgi:hypothetical protein
MPSTSPDTIGLSHPRHCATAPADRRYDRRAFRSVCMLGLVLLIMPDGASGPAGWRAFGRAQGPAGVADRTELSGAVPLGGITPSEFIGVNANELTGFVRGIRGGTFKARAAACAYFKAANGGAK